MQYLGPLALVFLVSTTTRLVTYAVPQLHCQYDLKADQQIDFEQSRSLGATFVTIKAIHAVSAAACAQACCTETIGKCSLGAYNPQVPSIQRCLLLQCSPLEACLTKNDSRGFQVAVINRTESKNRDSSFTTISSVLNNGDFIKKLQPRTKKPFSDNTSEILGPDGHTNQLHQQVYIGNSTNSDLVSVAAKETPSSTEIVSSSAQSLTNDKKHNDARKKTYEDHKLLQTKKKSDIKTTQTSSHETSSVFTYPYVDSLDVEKNKSSVGRKGVKDPPGEVSKPTNAFNTNVTMSPQVSSNISSFPIPLTNTNVSGDSLEGTQINNGESQLQNKEFIRTGVSNKTMKPSKIINTGVIPNKSYRLSGNTTMNTLTKVPGTKNSEQITKQSDVLNEMSNPALNFSSAPTILAITNRTSSFLNETASNSTTIDSEANGNSTLGEEEDMSDVQAGIHLVIALVIGLLLLLTVVGLVIRRVHDVWQRRHYQRVDFLVDGMYNTVQT